MNIWQIMLILFVLFIVIVKLVEHFGKPMSTKLQSKLSNVVMILVFLLLVIQLIRAWLMG